jgi:ABC-type cobalamin/Fe3+-siderophores transport system ATPase subunit
MKYAVEISNFFYENLFEDLTMNIEMNKFITLSSPNNCGKTTLIRILNREIITKSDIKVLGYPINDYSIDEYSSLVQCVIPNEKITTLKSVEEELKSTNASSDMIEWIFSGLKMKKIRNKRIDNLNQEDFIKYQLSVAIAKTPRILLIDSISPYFSDIEMKEIIRFLKEVHLKYPITIIYTTLDLEESILTDYLYIINDKKIALEGFPIQVLQKDNIINKIGLNIPFMVDLSVKLRDYNLIEDIELDKNRLVDLLWK